ncbi:hypothetical protein ACIQVK_40280 [Streptomyces sp. NPDC090493]|uniref:hypothetical protein n=1 Tax=Streptomyces sp. NPDC090493 TaxID=3365964 RepID=UPI003825F4FB
MTDPSRAFIRALAGVWGPDYWVTWHPSSRRSLGTVGPARYPGIVPVDTLPDSAVEPPEVTPADRSTLTWNTEGAVRVTFQGTAEAADPAGALADVRAGAVVEFTRKNALLVVYRGLTETRLADQPRLARELVRRYWAGDWDPDWCVVSHLVTARSGTVLMAADKGATVELGVSGSAAAGPVSLADLATQVRATRSAALQCELVGERLTPFYRVLRLRRRFLRGVEAEYGARGLRTPAGRPAEVPPGLLHEVESAPEAALEHPAQPAPPPDEEAGAG